MSKFRARAALVAAAAAAAVVLAPTGAANAAIPMCPPNNFCIYDYYDNPQMTGNSVGRTYVECDGTSSTTGETTRFVKLEVINNCPIP